MTPSSPNTFLPLRRTTATNTTTPTATTSPSHNPSPSYYACINQEFDAHRSMMDRVSLPHQSMIDHLRAAVDQGYDAPDYLVTQAIEIGHREITKEMLESLREEFRQPEEIAALGRYFSDENYAAYIGNQNQTAPAGLLATDEQREKEMVDMLEDIKRTACCALQAQGSHTVACRSFDWENVDEETVRRIGMGKAEASNTTSAAEEFHVEEDADFTVLHSDDLGPDFFNNLSSGEQVSETDDRPSKRRKVDEAESSKTAAAREGVTDRDDEGRRILQVDEEDEPWNITPHRASMEGVVSPDPLFRGRLKGHRRTASSDSSFTSKSNGPCCNRTPNSPHERFCINRNKIIPLWIDTTPITRIPQFHFFTKLPHELRTTIYELALSNDAPIAPQLCDKAPNGRVQFHDAYQHSRQYPNHIAIARLLGVTRVSKQIRAESLPCFYSANTFAISSDTPTYFGYLEYLGRFNLIRRVELNIPKFKDYFAPQILAQMKTYMSDVKKYESSHPYPRPLGSAERKGKMRADNASTAVTQGPYQYFTRHPRYSMGGMKDMGMLIVASMLSSSHPPSAFPTPEPSSSLLSSSSGNEGKAKTTHLVLPVPNTTIFTPTNPTLTWFSSVLRGLDIKLHLVPDYPLRSHCGGSIGVLWEQRFQKSEFDAGMMGKGDGKEVSKRVKEMWPELGEGEGRFWERMTYLRGSCDGMEHVWWDVRF